jgi:hypothetical protein
MGKQTEIDIERIFVCEKQKKKIDWNKVWKHAKAFENGKNVVAIDVVRVEDFYTISGNGRHRYFGAIAAGYKTINCNILN